MFHPRLGHRGVALHRQRAALAGSHSHMANRRCSAQRKDTASPANLALNSAPTQRHFRVLLQDPVLASIQWVECIGWIQSHPVISPTQLRRLAKNPRSVARKVYETAHDTPTCPPACLT